MLSRAADLLTPPHFGKISGAALVGADWLNLGAGELVVGLKNVGGSEDGKIVLSSLERVLFRKRLEDAMSFWQVTSSL